MNRNEKIVIVGLCLALVVVISLLWKDFDYKQSIARDIAQKIDNQKEQGRQKAIQNVAVIYSVKNNMEIPYKNCYFMDVELISYIIKPGNTIKKVRFYFDNCVKEDNEYIIVTIDENRKKIIDLKTFSDLVNKKSFSVSEIQENNWLYARITNLRKKGMIVFQNSDTTDEITRKTINSLDDQLPNGNITFREALLSEEDDINNKMSKIIPDNFHFLFLPDTEEYFVGGMDDTEIYLRNMRKRQNQ